MEQFDETATDLPDNNQAERNQSKEKNLSALIQDEEDELEQVKEKLQQFNQYVDNNMKINQMKQIMQLISNSLIKMSSQVQIQDIARNSNHNSPKIIDKNRQSENSINLMDFNDSDQNNKSLSKSLAPSVNDNQSEIRQLKEQQLQQDEIQEEEKQYDQNLNMSNNQRNQEIKDSNSFDFYKNLQNIEVNKQKYFFSSSISSNNNKDNMNNKQQQQSILQDKNHIEEGSDYSDIQISKLSQLNDEAFQERMSAKKSIKKKNSQSNNVIVEEFKRPNINNSRLNSSGIHNINNNNSAVDDYVDQEERDSQINNSNISNDSNGSNMDSNIIEHNQNRGQQKMLKWSLGILGVLISIFIGQIVIVALNQEQLVFNIIHKLFNNKEYKAQNTTYLQLELEKSSAQLIDSQSIINKLNVQIEESKEQLNQRNQQCGSNSEDKLKQQQELIQSQVQQLQLLQSENRDINLTYKSLLYALDENRIKLLSTEKDYSQSINKYESDIQSLNTKNKDYVSQIGQLEQQLLSIQDDLNSFKQSVNKMSEVNQQQQSEIEICNIIKQEYEDLQQLFNMLQQQA